MDALLADEPAAAPAAAPKRGGMTEAEFERAQHQKRMAFDPDDAFDLDEDALLAAEHEERAKTRPADEVVELEDDAEALAAEAAEAQRRQEREAREKEQREKEARDAQEQAKILADLPQGDYVAFTGADGLRKYIRRQAGGFGAKPAETDRLLEVGIPELRKLIDATPAQREFRAPPPGAETTLPLVDKYRPSRFVDLLSDEWVGREILLWLKSFTPNKVQQSRLPEWLQGGPRDVPKLVLVSGPPGVGKTTLCKLAAKKAGFRPVEVNASEERVASKIEQRVKEVCGMNAVVGSLPQMLILDEIDGVDGEKTGQALARLLEKNSGAVKRPILGVCNNINVRGLQALREVAKVFYLHAPDQQVLQRRMKDICAAEDCQMDAAALQRLVQEAKGDVRSALNVLQGLRDSYRGYRITLRDVEMRLTVDGMKDQKETDKSVLDVVFAPARSRRRKGNSQELQAKVLAMAPQLGFEFGRFAEVLDEVLPQVPFSDPNLTVARDCYHHLAEADVQFQQMMQNGTLGCVGKHLLTAPLLFAHVHCAANQVFKLDQALSSAKKHKFFRGEVKKTSLHVLQDLRKPGVVRAETFRHLDRRFIPMVAPSLLRVLSPRCPAAQHWGNGQKPPKELAHAIDVMLSFGLEYPPPKGGEPRLQPRLDYLVGVGAALAYDAFGNALQKDLSDQLDKPWPLPSVQELDGRVKATLQAALVQTRVLREADRREEHEQQRREQQPAADAPAAPKDPVAVGSVVLVVGVQEYKDRKGTVIARQEDQWSVELRAVEEPAASVLLFPAKNLQVVLEDRKVKTGMRDHFSIEGVKTREGLARGTKRTSTAAKLYKVLVEYNRLEGHTNAVRREVYVRDFFAPPPPPLVV